MFYLHTQIFFALLIAVALGWFITRLLQQNRDNELIAKYGQLRAEFSQQNEAIDHLKSQQNLYNQREQIQLANYDRLIKSRQALQGQVTVLKKEIENNHIQAENQRQQGLTLGQQISDLNTEKHSLMDDYQRVMHKHEQAMVQIKNLTGENNQALQRLAESDSRYKQLSQQMALLTHEKENYHGKFRALSDEHSELQSRFSQTSQERDDYQARLQNSGHSNDKLSAECLNLSREREEYQARMQVIQDKADELTASVNSLGKERDELRIRLLTVETLTSEITSPVKNDYAPLIPLAASGNS